MSVRTKSGADWHQSESHLRQPSNNAIGKIRGGRTVRPASHAFLWDTAQRNSATRSELFFKTRTYASRFLRRKSWHESWRYNFQDVYKSLLDPTIAIRTLSDTTQSIGKPLAFRIKWIWHLRLRVVGSWSQRDVIQSKVAFLDIKNERHTTPELRATLDVRETSSQIPQTNLPRHYIKAQQVSELFYELFVHHWNYVPDLNCLQYTVYVSATSTLPTKWWIELRLCIHEGRYLSRY